MITKFRYWDIDEEEMCNDIYFSWQDCGYESLNECLSDKRFVFSQSTGLKDINGKEIYEGDIVLIELIGSELEYDNVRSCLGHVIYDDGVFDVKHSGASTGIIPELYLSGHNYQIKLLGNIFQNPNLLEADNHE